MFKNICLKNFKYLRYDKAPSYFVLIDKVDLSNYKFKEDIKNLINQIIAEKGTKISVEILDDEKALELMYKVSMRCSLVSC